MKNHLPQRRGKQRREKSRTCGPAFAALVRAPSVPGGERYAFADLNDRLVYEFDRTLAMPALIGDSRFQFRARIVQEPQRCTIRGCAPSA
jgi:hypothetical protein